MKTENYEVIFAIVNAGFAEDVMDVAGLAVPEPEKGMISIKKHPKGCFFAARITNNGSKGKNPSYSSFRANACERGNLRRTRAHTTCQPIATASAMPRNDGVFLKLFMVNYQLKK